MAAINMSMMTDVVIQAGQSFNIPPEGATVTLANDTGIFTDWDFQTNPQIQPNKFELDMVDRFNDIVRRKRPATDEIPATNRKARRREAAMRRRRK